MYKRLISFGLISGLLSSILFSLEQSVFLYFSTTPGIIFGLLSFLFITDFLKEKITFKKLVLWTIASTIIWTILYFFLFYLVLFTTTDPEINAAGTTSSIQVQLALILGGIIGSFLMSLIFSQFFHKINSNQIKKFTLYGGILALAGLMFDLELVMIVYHSILSNLVPNYLFIFIFWQVGMLYLFTFYISKHQNNNQATTNQSPPATPSL